MTRKIKGFTLIEILITLSVILLITISSFFIYKKVSENNKTNIAIGQLIKKEINSTPSNIIYEDSFKYMVEYNKDLDPKFILNNKLKNIWVAMYQS